MMGFLSNDDGWVGPMGVMTEALTWVNEARRMRGLPGLDAFPPGVPCDPAGCPVSRALDADISFRGLVVPHDGTGGSVRLPAVVRRFANEFDLGRYPALEVGAGPTGERVAAVPALA